MVNAKPESEGYHTPGAATSKPQEYVKYRDSSDNTGLVDSEQI